MIINLNGRKSNSKQNTSPQSYKTQINILPFPGLAQTGTEQLGQGATLLGWPKSIYYAKPSNKMLIIPQQKKNCYFAIGFYFFGTSIQKHPDSVCENDVNNEQNVRGYNMSNH